MPIFSYVAVSKQGKEMKGKLEAENYQAAITKLREMGYYPTGVTEDRGRGEKPGEAAGGQRERAKLAVRVTALGEKGKIGQKHLTLFTRQLATLIASNLPLVRALYVLERQQKSGAMKDTIHGLAEQVEGGASFSEALLKYPKSFSPLYINTIKAGEAGGVLEVVLTRLAEFAEKTQSLNSRIRAALVYPALVSVLAISVLFFLITFIVPKFMSIFKEMGIPLPFITRLLLFVSEFARSRWFVGLAVFVGLFLVYKFLCRLPRMRVFFDDVRLRLPVMGQLIRRIAIARFSRTLGTLLTSGVPILQALLVAKDTAGNEVIARSIVDVHNSVREGETVGKPLLKAGIFPAMAVNMISVGEETGSLDQMLLKVADVYDEEVDVAVSGLMSLLEPFLIIGMGIVVGFIVVAMFMPLFSLITALGGGT